MVRYLFYTIGDLTYQSPLVEGKAPPVPAMNLYSGAFVLCVKFRSRVFVHYLFALYVSLCVNFDCWGSKWVVLNLRVPLIPISYYY